jgi:hypothetical protein
MGYRNEQGRQAIENWFGGFEHGARVAQEGGYRERATIPSSLYADPSAAPAEAWQQHPGGVEPIDMPLQSPTPANAPTPADAPPVDLPSPDELFEQGTASRSGLLPSDLAPPAEFPAELIKQQALANHNESRVSSDPRLTTGTTGGSAAAVLQADYATPTGLLASELPAGDRPSELPPETAGDLPPAPPWHPSTGGVQRASAQVAASTDVSTSSANPEAFDPFGGTPFEAISHGTRGDASAPSSPSTMTPLPASGSSTPMATEPVKPRPARPALPTTSATSAPSSAPLAIPTQSNHVADEIDSAPLLLNAPLQMPMTELPLPPVGQNDAPAPLKLHHLPAGSMPPMASAPTKPLLLPAQLGNASSDRANSIALPQGAAQGAAHDDAISAGGEIVHDTGSSNGGEAAGANELRIENWEMQEQPTSDDANSGWQAKESEPRTQWKGVQ